MSKSMVARAGLYFAIPALAIAVAGRQAYYNAFHGLSTWKGGGMGMFAAADAGASRYTRIYIEAPDGRRQPIVRLLPAQDHLLQRALWFPAEHNFLALARSLRRTAFVASDQPSPVGRSDANGNRIGLTGRSHYLLHANAVRPAGDDPDWTLVIEYWTASFDPATRLATARLEKTMRYGREAS